MRVRIVREYRDKSGRLAGQLGEVVQIDYGDANLTYFIQLEHGTEWVYEVEPVVVPPRKFSSVEEADAWLEGKPLGGSFDLECNNCDSAITNGSAEQIISWITTHVRSCNEQRG
jgi:hypothetical protein